MSPALILHIVNGKHALGIGIEAAILCLQQCGNHSGLPIVTLDHIGDIIHCHHGIHTGLGEKSKSLTIVQRAVNRTVTLTKVVIVIDKVDLHTVFPVCKPHHAHILPPPAQSHMELGHLLHLIGRVFFNFLIVGQYQHHFISLNTGKSRRQRLHYVT